jgi:hypothetical protein
MKPVCIAGKSTTNREHAHKKQIQAGEIDLWGLPWDSSIKKHYGPVTRGCEDSSFEADLWFEIHDPELWQGGNAYLSLLGNMNSPIVFAHASSKRNIEPSLVFPWVALRLSRIMPGHIYLESSIAYMLVYAYLQGRMTIYLDGIDMTLGHEYEYQRPNLAYLIGYMRACGIEIISPPGCGIHEFTTMKPNIGIGLDAVLTGERCHLEFQIGWNRAMGMEGIMSLSRNRIDLLTSIFPYPGYYGPHAIPINRR